MKKLYSPIILLLIVGMLLGVFSGCAAGKTPTGTQNVTQGQQRPENSHTTSPEIPDHSQPDNSDPTIPVTTQPIETDPEATEPVTEPEATDAVTEPNSTDPSTEPDDPTTPTAPTEPEATNPPAGTGVTYLDYYAMSADEQQLFIDSFGSLDAFFAWHTAAKEEYESGRTPIDGGNLNP